MYKHILEQSNHWCLKLLPTVNFYILLNSGFQKRGVQLHIHTSTHLKLHIMKMSFRYAAYQTSEFKSLCNLDIAQKLANGDTAPSIIVCFTRAKHLFFL